MGDGGVACVPSQHIMERFSICGGKANGSNTNTSTSTTSSKLSSSSPNSLAKMNAKNMKKLKREKEKRGELGLKSSVNIEKEAVVSNSYGNSDSNNNGDVIKDEVEEGELGTLPIENGEFIVERPTRKYEIRSEIEKGEIVGEKWRKDGEVEKGEFLSGKWRKTDAGSWRTSSKDEVEKGEFIPDRWRRSEVVKDDYSYVRGRRYDSVKDRGWKGEWSPPPPPPPPPPSGKYSSEKEPSRSGSQLIKRPSRYESGIPERTPRISSRIVDEDRYELSNGKNHAREYSSSNKLKRQGLDSEISDRKFRSDPDDSTSSKSRKVSDDGSRSVYSSENHSRSYRNNSSSRNVSSDRYSSRHYDSSRVVHEKYNSSPHHSERSPHDRARYHDYRDWSPARHDRSPYDRSSRYDHSRSPYDRNHHHDRSRSPYDRSRHFDHRKRSPSYSEWSPQDQARHQDRRGRTPSFLERSPDHARSRESNRRSGVTEKRQTYNGSRGPEEKPNQKDPGVRDLRILAKETEDRSSNDSDNGTKSIKVGPSHHKEEPSQAPDAIGVEASEENGPEEELMSMEEDMDICNTPPHEPVVADAITGKWFYLDHFGEEQGPSRLSDLKKLVEEGFLVSDHFIKHLDSDRWVTVENAVSPLVTANFLPIVSDTVTQLVSPPEAPGNVLADNGDVSESLNLAGGGIAEDSLAALEPLDDLHIDERVGALLDGFTVTPGRELETLGEVLQIAFENGEWERWKKIEGFTWHQLQIGEFHDLRSGESIFTSESVARGSLEPKANVLAPFEKDSTFACDNIEWFSGLWSCKGGDWKRSDEAAQDRSWRKKLVLNDGYPLCQMPKSGCEDPRRHQKDELYSQGRRLDLPPWAFTSPDEWNDAGNMSRSKPNIARGVRGMILPVVRINACVVKDHDSFVSEPPVKSKGKERYPSRSSRNYSATSDTKRSSEEGVSRPKSSREQDSHGSWKSRVPLSVPKDRICSADELQLNLGEWYYFDGVGHERGPFSFSELQVLADQGVIQKHSSIFRKVDKIWVPISSAEEMCIPDGRTQEARNDASSVTHGASLLGSSDATLRGSSTVSSTFHSLHPQFIGFTRGKLHELVMKSYKSREFAAAINEVLDPWINARQPKKEVEKHVSVLFQQSDQFRASKRPRIDDHEMEDISTSVKEEYSFDDICSDANFNGEEGLDAKIETRSWNRLDRHVLARVFHFLRADMNSLASVGQTCRLWRSVLNCYRNVSRQVDLSSIALRCNDAVLLSILNAYNKEKICTLVLRGCSGVTSSMLEEVLKSCPSLSSVDIRGCSQLEDLGSKFPNINWTGTHGSHLKTRSLKYLNDQISAVSRTPSGLNSQIEDSSGLRDYLENSDRRESANRLFRQSMYKRSKLFDARKSSSILSRDAHLRRWAIRKSENGYKRMEEYLALSLKDIMKENTFEFFVPKVAQVEERMRNGYYAGRGLSSVKDDISRMCRDAIKAKNRGDSRGINRIITLFIRLATSLEGGSRLSYEKDEAMNIRKEDSPPGFSSTLKYKKNLNKLADKKSTVRSNGSSSINGLSDCGDYASDREIKRRLSKLNKKSVDSESETSEELDRSCDESMSASENTASETESDSDLRSEAATGDPRGESYFPLEDGFDSLANEREWGARMTKASLVPPVTRKYEVIDHYVVVADEEEVKRKMRVSLPEDYTEKLNAQRNGTEESDMEIPEVKDYKPRKYLGDEVIEQEVYGIDPYTHNLLLDSMPEESEWSLLDKHTFIEDVLLRTLNKQVRNFTGSGNTPMIYPLKPVFEDILEASEESQDWRTVRLCEFILKAIDNRPEDNYVAYRKGLGVVCNKEDGFAEEDFVVEFLGEVYPAWKWFEKQDGIRSLQKNSKDPAPEFYNIILERPKGDADGYDLVVVDAMHKANYASRICHSCRPNCEAKVTAVAGQYQIGIYTVRPIRLGEEITFDYNSVTESKEEYEASVCLCGSQVCRGSYLNLTGEGAFQKVLKEYHGILDRHQLMVEACELNSVSEEDYIDLLKAGLGSCLLDGLPDWLIAYSARLVRFINFERTRLPKEILKHNLEEKKKYFAEISMEVEKSDAEVQAEGVYNQRLQNLAITIDKVRYVMSCVFGDPKKALPPLERLSPNEAASYVWIGEGSLVEELIQSMAPHMDDSSLSELKAKIHAHDPSASEDVQLQLWKSLIWLRDEVRNLPCTYKCRHDAAADLIHTYAYTKSFFRIREYKTVTSPPVYISPLDLCPKYADKLGSAGHEYCKTYGENYCLGQLMFWYNQTYADPDSNLARASRGCLSLPDIGSFYAKVQKPSRQRVYGPRTVKFMLASMEKQPQRPWPKDRIWSFKNFPKIVGSPMLDAVLNKCPLDKELVHWLKHRPPIFQAMWDR